MKVHATAIFLTLFCSVIGQSYLECFHVQAKTKLNNKNQKTRVTVKGRRCGRRQPLSSVFQRISSKELFQMSGYPPNVVCEYHFSIDRTAKLKFTNIHLDEKAGDVSGTPRSGVCKKTWEAPFRDRDYIAVNVDRRRNVFCGRHGKQVSIKLRRNKLRQLTVTFWSDASFAGDGFDGYFVDLRKTPDLKNCGGLHICERLIQTMGWQDFESMLETSEIEILNGTYVYSKDKAEDYVLEWMINQSQGVTFNCTEDNISASVSDATPSTSTGSTTVTTRIITSQPTTSRPARPTSSGLTTSTPTLVSTSGPTTSEPTTSEPTTSGLTTKK